MVINQGKLKTRRPHTPTPISFFFNIKSNQIKLKMKTTELRIGNWINDDRNVPTKVFALDSEINHDFQTEDYAYISLTEEILLKCGFENNQVEKYNPKDEYADQFEYTLDIGIFYRKLVCKPFYGWNCKIEETDMIPIEFLHELQNLYHAIKREELEINL